MLRLITPPAVEPVTLAEAKLHSRVTFDQDDDLITALITVAREQCEHEVERSFITTAWRLILDDFPGYWADGSRFPKADLIAVTAITYTDPDGIELTVDPADYIVWPGAPGWVFPSYSTSWPTPRDQFGAVTIDFTAGYGDTAADVPQSIKLAIRMMVGTYYEYREDVQPGSSLNLRDIPRGIRAILAPFDWGGTRV